MPQSPDPLPQRFCSFRLVPASPPSTGVLLHMQTKHKQSRAAARSAAMLACLTFAGSSGLAHAAKDYTLTIVAKDGDSLGGQKIMLPQGGGINASGTVVFAASYICGPGGQSCTNVYRTSLSNLTASPFLVQANTFGIPRIDNRGTVVFGCAGGALCTRSSGKTRRHDRWQRADFSNSGLGSQRQRRDCLSRLMADQ